jgi:hypothetical protein
MIHEGDTPFPEMPMKRNDFLKTCAAGVCGCSVLGLLAPDEARPENASGQAAPVPDDLARAKAALDGARERFAALLGVMAERLDEAAYAGILKQLGRECASKNAPFFEKYRGDLEGFTAAAKTAWLENSEYDEKAGVLRVSGKPSPCYCPLVKTGRTPSRFCTCTLGWQEAAYSIILGKPVTAEIEETVLSGGSRCSFRITVKG